MAAAEAEAVVVIVVEDVEEAEGAAIAATAVVATLDMAAVGIPDIVDAVILGMVVAVVVTTKNCMVGAVGDNFSGQFRDCVALPMLSSVFFVRAYAFHAIL